MSTACAGAPGGPAAASAHRRGVPAPPLCTCGVPREIRRPVDPNRSEGPGGDSSAACAASGDARPGRGDTKAGGETATRNTGLASASAGGGACRGAQGSRGDGLWRGTRVGAGSAAASPAGAGAQGRGERWRTAAEGVPPRPGDGSGAGGCVDGARNDAALAEGGPGDWARGGGAGSGAVGHVKVRGAGSWGGSGVARGAGGGGGLRGRCGLRTCVGGGGGNSAFTNQTLDGRLRLDDKHR